ncbi:MAG: hypothetical protein FWF78_05465 [Defluviitaleaceae bacterium]|nr:hypothetical protein [Defluviitaleaceae bacterium]
MNINFSTNRPIQNNNNFRAERLRAPSAIRNRGDARHQHRQREARLREREEARIEVLRSGITEALTSNASIREQFEQTSLANDSLQGLIESLQSPRENETSEEMHERLTRLAEALAELPATQESLIKLEEQLAESDIHTIERVAKLEELIATITEARAERDRLNLSIELKLSKLHPDEDNAQLDAIFLLSHARDKLSEKALEIQPETEQRNQERKLERIQEQINRLNAAIEKMLDIPDDAHDYLYNNDPNDDSLININV